jgi:hypothetical protein
MQLHYLEIVATDVDSVCSAVAAAIEAGGEVAHPSLEIPGRGSFAIYVLAGVHHGLWQL